MTRLEAIKARVDAATSGPWREGTLNVWQDKLLRCVARTERGGYQAGEFKPDEETDSREQMQADAAFIAHGWADIRDLLAVAEAAAALPWVERGMLVAVDGYPGLTGPSKDARLRRLQSALAPLLKEND